MGPLILVMLFLLLIFGGFKDIGVVPILLGIFLTIIGFSLFLIGLKSGLLLMGELIGVHLMNSGKFSLLLGTFIALGFSVTFAEPGVMILAKQMEIVSDGLVARLLLILAVALGVAIFMLLALLRMLFNLKIKQLLLASYTIVFILAFLTKDIFLAISFDAGGVTTGPLTVPFILSLGIGMNSIRKNQAAVDSFGFVALASVGPIIAVMLIGVFI
jgi:hypothetical protein